MREHLAQFPILPFKLKIKKHFLFLKSRFVSGQSQLYRHEQTGAYRAARDRQFCPSLQPREANAEFKFYNAVEAQKYSSNSRVQSIQAEMTYRCLELLNLSVAVSSYP